MQTTNVFCSRSSTIKSSKLTVHGYLLPTERASVSAISLRHILAYPGYTPGTIAVNVTWKLQLFSLSACILGCSYWNSGIKFSPQETRIVGLPGCEDSLTIGWAVSTIPACDGQTDRRPAYINNVRSMTDHWRTLKTRIFT